jgi:hypothetical protein
MAEIRQKTKRLRICALILSSAVASLCLSASIGLLCAPVRAEAAQARVTLLARLSLIDSAIGRSQKLAPNLESKAQRRIEPLHPSLSINELALLELRSRFARTIAGERSYSLTAISPPSDRAPPRLFV